MAEAPSHIRITPKGAHLMRLCLSLEKRGVITAVEFWPALEWFGERWEAHERQDGLSECVAWVESGRAEAEFNSRAS